MIEDLHKPRSVDSKEGNAEMNQIAASVVDTLLFWGINIAVAAGLFFGARKVFRKVRGVK